MLISTRIQDSANFKTTQSLDIDLPAPDKPMRISQDNSKIIAIVATFKTRGQTSVEAIKALSAALGLPPRAALSLCSRSLQRELEKLVPALLAVEPSEAEPLIEKTKNFVGLSLFIGQLKSHAYVRSLRKVYPNNGSRGKHVSQTV